MISVHGSPPFTESPFTDPRRSRGTLCVAAPVHCPFTGYALPVHGPFTRSTIQCDLRSRETALRSRPFTASVHGPFTVHHRSWDLRSLRPFTVARSRHRRSRITPVHGISVHRSPRFQTHSAERQACPVVSRAHGIKSRLFRKSNPRGGSQGGVRPRVPPLHTVQPSS